MLTHGFAYTDDQVFETGPLRGKRAMLSITTGGTPEEFQADSVYTGTMDEFLKPFSGGVLRYVGLEVLPPFLAYATSDQGLTGRAEQIKALQQQLKGLIN